VGLGDATYGITSLRSIFQKKQVTKPGIKCWLKRTFAICGPKVRSITQRLFDSVVEVVTE
jgi:hypothetical protein